MKIIYIASSFIIIISLFHSTEKQYIKNAPKHKISVEMQR